MKKEFWIKKDPTKDGQDNWIKLNSFEFLEFIKTEEGNTRKRNIAELPGNEPGETIIYMEVDNKTAKEWRAEHDRKKYITRLKKRLGIEIISYDISSDIEGDSLTCEDILEDEECNVEETVLHHLELADMRQAIASLSIEEEKLISFLLDCEMNITISELSKLIGLTFDQTRYMRDCAYAKIRIFVGK